MFAALPPRWPLCCDRVVKPAPCDSRYGLGLDAGGTATRWLLLEEHGRDIELACRASFAPGHGILVMAGTGSIAAHLRADSLLERAGGRDSLLDDGGSGYWIAREALRGVWRREDATPCAPSR